MQLYLVYRESYINANKCGGEIEQTGIYFSLEQQTRSFEKRITSKHISITLELDNIELCADSHSLPGLTTVARYNIT